MPENYGRESETVRLLASDLRALVKEPFIVGADDTRFGRYVVVSTTSDDPADHDIVSVTVSMFLLHLPAPAPTETGADVAAIAAAAVALADPDEHVRMAAAQAIGQIGGEGAKNALRSAAEDRSPAVRAIVERARSMSDVPRVTQADLTELWGGLRIDADRRSAAFQGRSLRATATLRGVRRNAWCQLAIPETAQETLAASMTDGGEPHVWVLMKPELKVLVKVLATADGYELVAVSPEQPPEDAHRLAVVLTNVKTNEVFERLPVGTLEKRDRVSDKFERFELPAFTQKECWFRYGDYAISGGGEKFALSLGTV